MRTNEKGITLVALVITIVLLIVLSTVTINVAMGQNGLINQARQAKALAQQDATEEEGKLNTLIGTLTDIISGIPEITVEYALENNLEFTDTTKIIDDLKNIITIPGGFHIAEDSGIKVEEGIVIEDDIGNQFVWIPVGEYNVSSTIESTGKLINNLSRRTFTSDTSEEIESEGIIEQHFYGEENTNSIIVNSIDNFISSAEENKGFYVGRYEQGEGNVCKSGVNPYVNITRDQALITSELMYNTNQYVTSDLISSYAWDTTLNFICQTSEKGYALATTTNRKDANIATNSKTKTGEYPADKYSNICDFLGNCYEWTTEYSSVSGKSGVDRGGVFNYDRNYAAKRDEDNIEDSDSYRAFRVQLYIKQDMTPITQYTNIYVTRYADGTLAFCSTNDKIEGKQIVEGYGNIVLQSYTVNWKWISGDGGYSMIETDTPWYDDREKITSVIFVDEITPYSVTGWFGGCTNLTEIYNIENLNTSMVDSMEGMFSWCTSLKKLDLSTFDTSNVTNLNSMFYYSTGIEEITFSEKWNTSKVTNMAWMFATEGNTKMSIKNITGLEYFNTSSLNRTNGMFYNCTKITSLDLRNFDTSNVTDMTKMFGNCSSLKTVYVSKSKWVQVQDNNTVFPGCKAQVIKV